MFLFPRAAAGVEWFERELAAYQALAGTKLSVVPRLLGRWEDALRLRHALSLLTDPRDPAVVGTIGEHLAHL